MLSIYCQSCYEDYLNKPLKCLGVTLHWINTDDDDIVVDGGNQVDYIWKKTKFNIAWNRMKHFEDWIPAITVFGRLGQVNTWLLLTLIYASSLRLDATSMLS